jgi:hypothetical protein
MKQSVLLRWSAFLSAILISAALATAAPVLDQIKRTAMTMVSPRLEHIFLNTKPVCFGRFIIDVPATATVVFGRMTVDFEVTHLQSGASGIDKHIADQMVIFEKEKYLSKRMNTPGSLYGQIVTDGIPGQKTFVGADYDSYSVSSYVPLGADLFVFETNGILNPKEVRKDIDEIASISRKLRARASDDIPVAPGICLEGGFVNVNPTFENISMGIRLAEFPDVHLSISTLKNGDSVADYEKLENRLKAAERDAIEEGKGELYKRIKFFRRAPRQMGDWVGEEALARMPPENGGFASHQFQFYAMGAANDILRPVADVQLDTGVKGNATKGREPSVTDEEAVAIWDRLTGSIRARPTTPSSVAKK